MPSSLSHSDLVLESAGPAFSPSDCSMYSLAMKGFSGSFSVEVIVAFSVDFFDGLPRDLTSSRRSGIAPTVFWNFCYSTAAKELFSG